MADWFLTAISCLVTFIVTNILRLDADPLISYWNSSVSLIGCLCGFFVAVRFNFSWTDFLRICGIVSNGSSRISVLKLPPLATDVYGPYGNKRQPDTVKPSTNDVDEIEEALGKIIHTFNACPVCNKNRTEGTHTHRRSVVMTRVDGVFGFSYCLLNGKWFFINELQSGRGLEKLLVVGDRILFVNNKAVTNLNAQTFRNEIISTPSRLSLVVEYKECLTLKLERIWARESWKQCAQGLQEFREQPCNRKAARPRDVQGSQISADSVAPPSGGSFSQCTDVSQTADSPLTPTAACPGRAASQTAIPAVPVPSSCAPAVPSTGTSVSSAVFPNVDATPFIPNRQSQKNVTCAPTVLLQQHGKMTERNAGFLWEARAGNMKKVQEYLRQGADINATNANGLNALHLASKERHVELVRLLLKHGASVDAVTRKGNTALHIACLAGQYEIVRILIEHGAAVNVQSLIGFTPLYMAAQENHRDIVNHLLEKDANPSLSTEEGCTPLLVASQQGHEEIVSILLEYGKVRLPALHIAAKKEDVKAPVLPINADVISENNRRPDERTEAVTLPPTNVDEIKDALGKIMLAFNACPVCKQNKSEGTHTHRRSVKITRVDGDFGFSDSRFGDKWFFISKLKPGRDLENKLAVGDRILSVNNKDITNWDVQCFRDEITRTPTTLSLVVEYEERLVEKLQGIWGLERLKECAQKLKQLPRYNSRKAERKPEGHALQGVAGQGAQTLFESLSHANDASQSANLPLASAVSCPPNVVSPAAIPTASVSLASVQTAISTDPLISSAVAQSALLTKREQEISGSQCVPERIVPPTSSSVSSATPPSAAAASSVPNRPCLENTAYSQIAVPKASVLQNAPIEIRIPLVIRLSVQSEVEAGRESRTGVTVVSEPTSGSVATECETSAPPKASDPVGKSVETTDIPNTDTDKLAETSRKSVIVSAEYNSAAPPDASEPVEKQVSTTGTPNTENPAETERSSVLDSDSKDQIACSSDCESDDDKEKSDALGPPKTSKAVKTLGVGFTNVEKKTRNNAAPVDTAEFLKQKLGPGWKEEWNKLCSNARERGAFKAPDLAAQLQSAMEQLCTPKRENCSPPRRNHIGDKMYKQFGVIYSSEGVVDAVAYLPYRDAEVDFRRLKTQTGLHDLIAADTLPQLDFETVLVSLTDSINISDFDNLPKSVQRYVTASRIKRHGGGEAWRAPIFECQATLCSRKSKSWNNITPGKIRFGRTGGDDDSPYYVEFVEYGSNPYRAALPLAFDIITADTSLTVDATYGMLKWKIGNKSDTEVDAGAFEVIIQDHVSLDKCRMIFLDGQKIARDKLPAPFATATLPSGVSGIQFWGVNWGGFPNT